MKYIKKILVLVSCFILAATLVGCQGGGSSNAQSVDNSQAYYVLVVGNDSRIGTIEIDNKDYADGTGRSDTLMLARINPVNHQVTLVTIPRDTGATFDGKKTKINEVYRQKGIRGLIADVEQLTGVSIKYYLDMSFVQFDAFVDEIGGVTANVPIPMSLTDIIRGTKISLEPGTQELNGAEALVLARTRKAYAVEIEAARQIQDRQIVESAIRQVAKDPLTAAANVQTLMTNMETNWPADDLLSTVLDFVDNADDITIISGTGPFAGDYDDSVNGLWIVPRDEAKWKEVMDVVSVGGDPKTVVSLPIVAAA